MISCREILSLQVDYGSIQIITSEESKILYNTITHKKWLLCDHCGEEINAGDILEEIKTITDIKKEKSRQIPLFGK